MNAADTIYALSSGRLPSGVAVIRLSGRDVRTAVETLTGKLPEPRRATLSRVTGPDGQLIDHGLVLFFPGPSSFTGEDCAELHIHGGRAVVSALLDALSRIENMRHAEAGEFTRRAFLNGKMDLLEAEGLADLITAETEAQRRFALANADGAQSALYEQWRTRLIHARAMIEAELDFADEADVPPSVSRQIWDAISQLRDEIRSHKDGYTRAEIIRDGFDVVILGAPNAGKSSLLNALAGREVAIVTEEAGTTRDLIEVSLDLGGIKVRLTDTAGLRDAAGRVETLGIERAIARAGQANLIIHLEDMATPAPVSGIPDSIPVIRVGSKSDLISDYLARSAYDLQISVRSGEGIDDLVNLIGRRAGEAAGEVGDILPSRFRHLELLSRAENHLGSALEENPSELELRAEDLRLAGEALGRISGVIDVEDLLDVIFSHFCIGK